MRAIRFVVGWLSLALIGWLGYALTRALAAIIYLGVPFFDWQWYAPSIVLITVVPLCLLDCRLRPQAKRISRRMVVILMSLLIWVVLGVNGFGQTIELQPNTEPAPPVSFWSFSDFRQVPETLLRDLQVAGGSIFLSIGDVSKPENAHALAVGLKRLAEYDVPVYLAPSLSNFLSVPVYTEWITQSQHVAELIQREQLRNVRGLIGDAESPLNMPLDWLGRDRSNFDRMINQLRDSLEQMHRQFPNLQIGVTAMWPQFADRLDGDTDLAMVLRSPVDPPGNWDFINLMTYSSYYPADWRSYYIYVHETALARLYPASRRSHLIGLVGAGFPGEPLLSFDDLVRDAGLSRALGVQEIVIFQMTDALRAFGADFVGRVTKAINTAAQSPVTVIFSRPVSLMFYGTVALDAILDARSSQTWLWIGWLIVSSAVAWRWSRRRS
ncbi:MAG: hypothetical protein U0559_16995 [Anaerolineae bacterium]